MTFILKIYGIISEFNPFHKGHKYLVDQCKKMGATHITAIMSGNFVQRGDVAVVSKHIRTKMALLCGVDLVIELPLPFAVANAEVFAQGGVYLADSMGCIDNLAFGSECGSVQPLVKTAEIIESNIFKEQFKNEIAKGISYPTALTNTINSIDNSLSSVIASPNNVLGIEYIKAINKYSSNITPVTVKREGDSHNSTIINSEMASASNIRNLILNGKSIDKYIPSNALAILKDAVTNGETAALENNMRGLLLKLRNMSVEDIFKIADVTEGLENRFYNSIQHNCSIDEIIEKTKAKRYTQARIRRLLISCLLDITVNYTKNPPMYIRVLGFNKNGAEILNRMKHTAKVPVITKLTNLPKNISDNAKAMLNLEIKSTDIYNTFTNKIKPCGSEYTDGLVIVKQFK